jgi:hypothetical protein
MAHSIVIKYTIYIAQWHINYHLVNNNIYIHINIHNSLINYIPEDSILQ